MLVLLSFGLVLVATALLVLGLLVDSGLALIYGSIALSVIAAIVLFVAVRVSKPKEATSAAAPTLLLSDPAPAAAAVAGAAAGGEWPAADQGWEDRDEQWTATTDMPIDDYDALSVGEIVGVLGELDDDELALVKAHEEANAGRPEILTDIDRRLDADADPAREAPAKKAR